jgi:hypothetical protein
MRRRIDPALDGALIRAPFWRRLQGEALLHSEKPIPTATVDAAV